MRESITSGIICLDDEYGFSYVVSQVEYIEREDESFVYIFRPNYSVIDLLGPELFQGIPGLNLDLRHTEYIRKDKIPVFISERCPQRNRENLVELLESCNMDYYNPLEWLIRTDTRYFGDRLYVERYENTDITFKVSSIENMGYRIGHVCKNLLKYICRGMNVESSEISINDENRRDIYNLLMALYIKDKKNLDERRQMGIDAAVSAGRYKGRMKMNIDELKLAETIENYEGGKITGEEASKSLGISRSTFMRRIREK